MFEILQNFERTAAKFAPLVLILPGLTAVVVGLFVWLGGLGLKRLIAGVIGATAGGLCGFFLIGRNIASIAVSAGIAALVAITLDRVFIVVLAVALAAAFGFMVLAWPHLQPVDGDYETPDSGMTVRRSIETAKKYAVDFGYAAKWACSRMPVYSWAILAGVAVVLAVAGLCLWRLICALCCAVLGTMLIFAGMILLLLYKGAAPMTKMSGPDRSGVYAAVFLGMVAFGTIEQWLLFRRHKRQPAKAKKDDHEPERPKRSWRIM